MEVAPPSPPRRQWKAPHPGQVTTPEAAEGEQVRRDDERRAKLEGVELRGGWRSRLPADRRQFSLFLCSYFLRQTAEKETRKPQ